jgi:hypothetical protein
MRDIHFAGRAASAALILLVGVSACDGNSTSPSFTISGTVSGLATGHAVVLTDNDVDLMSVTNNGAFAFKTPVVGNGAYRVAVVTQPAGQVCTVSNGIGAGITTNVTNVKVACSSDMYSLSGTVSGLPSGERLMLENNGTDPLTVSENGQFSFATPIAYDGSYVVTVSTQPAEATCSVSNGMGAGVTANVSKVSVTCSPDSYSISGTVSGLASGMQVTVDDNGGDALTVRANGLFTFPAHIAAGASYTVTVGTQPTGQICTVSNGQGNHINGNVANVAVACTTETFTIGGTLSGLAGGAQVTLDNNGADPLTLTANAGFTFDTPVAYGSTYDVTVGTQPNGQFCTVSDGSGAPVTSNVAAVAVACTTNPVRFATPGTYTWTVPSGVTAVQILATAGGGGGGGMYGSNPGHAGGAGAVVTATLSVTPGQALNLVVGGGGGAGASGPGSSNQWTCGAGGGGGGATSVDAGSASQIIAGGGGGGGSCNNATAGGSGGNTGGAGGSGTSNGSATGGGGGSGGTGGAGGTNQIFFRSGANGGNGAGGPGGTGGNNSSSYPGGAGGSGVGAGSGGNDANNDLAGGGGGGYGGGGSGVMATGGGAGGSTGPNNSTYAPASNGGTSATNGGDGSIVITIQ